MVTPKQNIRIPRDRWVASMTRASQVHRTDAPKVVNAFLLMYNAGRLDDQVAAWLKEFTGVEHTPQRPEDAASG